MTKIDTVVQYLRDHGPQTVPQVRAGTDLSKGEVTACLKQAKYRGLVVSEGVVKSMTWRALEHRDQAVYEVHLKKQRDAINARRAKAREALKAAGAYVPRGHYHRGIGQGRRPKAQQPSVRSERSVRALVVDMIRETAEPETVEEFQARGGRVETLPVYW